MISFAVPVMDGNTVIGIVHRNYDLSNLHDMLAAQAENAFVVDRNGMVAAHSQYEIAEGVHDEVDVSTSEFYTSGADSGYYKSASAFGTIGYPLSPHAATPPSRTLTFFTPIVSAAIASLVGAELVAPLP